MLHRLGLERLPVRILRGLCERDDRGGGREYDGEAGRTSSSLLKSRGILTQFEEKTAETVSSYSYRSARIGSMRLARCAGIEAGGGRHHRQQDQRRRRGPRIAGARCRRAATRRSGPSASAAGMPTARPIASSEQDLPHHQPDHAAGSAPSARRMPSSLRRRATTNAITP